MLVNRPALHLIHLIELALEEDELLSRLRLRVHNTLLVLLERIDNLEEIALAHEELKVFGITSL